MSLILEALRKLDREKQVPERGFLVMAPAAWPSGGERRKRWAWLGVAALAAGFGAIVFLARAPRPRATGTPATGTPAVVEALSPPRVEATPVPERTVAAQKPPPMTAGGSSTPKPAPAPPATLVLSAPQVTAAAAKPQVPATPALVLQAITERDGQPVAMINDLILREGDEIEGVRLIAIGDTFVEIEHQGRRTTLRF